MKNTNTKKVIFLLVTTLFVLSSCNPEDGMDGAMGPQGLDGIQGPKGDSGEDAETPIISAYGKWEVTSGQFAMDDSRYVYINEDNTIDILAEDALGFKSDMTTNISVTQDQITLGGGGEGGFAIHNYELEADVMTIMPPSGEDPIILEKRQNDDEAANWIKNIIVLTEGSAPWGRDVDITFDGTYILGYEEIERNILKIDPNNFTVAGAIPTINTANTVEVEKSDSPFKQLFQSNNGYNKFKSYIYSSNELYYTSVELGSWIRGIASVEPGYLWASSSNAKALYYYKSNGSLTPGEILETIALDFQPNGIDFQDGFLYITERNRVHKCQTSPTFRAVETYKITNNAVDGIAHDGTNFWLSTGVWSGNDYTYKLLKVAMPN